jgi:cytochrome c oxidase subunit 2
MNSSQIAAGAPWLPVDSAGTADPAATWAQPELLLATTAVALLYLPGVVRAWTKAGRLRIAWTLFASNSVASLGVGQAQVLEPAGPAAAGVAQIFWVMLLIAAAICLLVYILLFTAVFRSRVPGGGVPPLGSGPFVVLGGIVLPLVILIPLLFWSLGLTAGVAEPSEDALTIEVVGHQWWWEVRYPEAGVTDANEIHIPVDRPVRLLLTSGDVIHSFWAPGLQGKMDLIPGNVNSLRVEADEVGIFQAKCAEFCGAQHANMQLLVVSEPQASFDDWLAARQAPPRPPVDPLVRRGQQVFLGSACVYCHTIEGTNASGDLGPDLTHMASRLTLGAGTIANNRGHLGGWIVNSQAIKPGNRMPPMYLESEDLQALLAYLETLE